MHRSKVGKFSSIILVAYYLHHQFSPMTIIVRNPPGASGQTRRLLSSMPFRIHLGDAA